MGLWVLGSTIYSIFVLGLPAQRLSRDRLPGSGGHVGSVLLLMRYKDGGANVRSVWLRSRNDAIGNVAVVGAAAAVGVTASTWPDLAIAIALAVLFLNSFILVLRQAWQELRSGHTGATLADGLRRR